MRLLSFFFLLVFGSGAASAQQSLTPQNSTHTLFKMIQCEAGRFGDSIRKQTIDPARMKVKVVITGTDLVVKKGSVAFAIGPFTLPKFLQAPTVQGEGSYTTKAIDGGQAVFNIHPDNADACSRRFDQIGVFDCLTKNIDLFLNGNAACVRETVLYGKASASGKITVLYFNVTPSAEYNATRTLNLTITAPPAKPEKPDTQQQ